MRHMLQDALGSRAKVALLRALSKSRQGYSARAACRQAGVSISSGLRALDELASLGLALMDTGGGQEYRYRLNRDHLLAAPLERLFDVESSVLAALIDCLAEEIGASGATGLLYGSVARGEDGPGSDLDVLLVGEPSETDVALSALYRGSERLQRRFGHHVSPLAMTRDEFAQSGAFRQAVEQDALHICGPALAVRRGDAAHSA